MINTVHSYRYPDEAPRSTTYRVFAGALELFVYHAPGGDFVAFDLDGPCGLVVQADRPLANARIAPRRLGIKTHGEDSRLSLELSGPANILIEPEGLPQLYIYANQPREAPAGTTHVFRAGQVHEVDELRLQDGQSVFLEGGAVVRGCIRATSGKGIRIAGQGVLSDARSVASRKKRRSIVLEGCTDSTVEDLVMIDPAGWMLSLGDCEDILVQNIHQLGTDYSTDGVDICGSRRIRVQGCMMRNDDDCVVIKSLDLRGTDARLDWAKEVRDIEISNCSFLSYLGGCAMEIGHELRTPRVGNVRFSDCDVLGIHQYGCAFGIHNADRAVVEDVVWENIRVEHHYDKLVDLRIVRSRWSRDEQRGRIRNVMLRNIDVDLWPYNAGYSVSLIGGHDAEHSIENVVFDNFRIAGKTITEADQMDLYTKHAEGIRFGAGSFDR